ncbi:MAG: hypothetical protein QXK94_00790 [Candidatus Jordarchaeales archaeon]
MKGRKLVKVGVILPSEFFNKHLEDFLKVNGVEISLELVISKGKRHKFMYLYCPSPDLIPPLSRAQALQGSSLNDVLLSISGNKKTIRTANIEKNILCIQDNDSPLYASLITFTPVSYQTICNLVERLESLSKNFDVDVYLIFPLKLKRASRYPKAAESGNFALETSPYIVLLSRNLSSLKNAVGAFSALVSCFLSEPSFVSSKVVARNLSKIICRLSVSNKYSLLEDISAFYAALADNQLLNSHTSTTASMINLGKVLINDRTVDLKVDEKTLNPLLILAKHKSSIVTLLGKIVSQLSHKLLIVDFSGLALQLRNMLGGGLLLSEKDSFTSFSLAPQSNTPMHDYFTHLLEQLAKTLNVSIEKNDMIQTILRSSRHRDIVSFISEVVYSLSESALHKDKLKEFLSDVESGILSKFFEKNRPTLGELFASSRIFLDLSGSTLSLSPTTIEFLTSLILDLCPRYEYALIMIAPSSIASFLTESHVMDKIFRDFSFSIFSTVGTLPFQIFQKFNSIITEAEVVDNRKSKLFSLSRKGCPTITFSITCQNTSLTLENESIIDIEAKIIQLMENHAYITEDVVSQSLGIPKETAHEVLNRLEKNIFYIKHVHLPTLDGKNVPVFFLETKTGKTDEVILSYAHDLIERICNETGLLLVELKDPKLGLDGFIENCPFKLALTDKEKCIERLLPLIKRIIEKHSSVLIIFTDERDRKLASELKQHFGDKVRTIYLNELNKLPLKLKTELLQQAQ